MNVYSENPLERFLASKQDGGPELSWPFSNWGAANAWLVLLGPSPGKDDGGAKGTHTVRVGLPCPIQFNTYRNRNPRWRKLWEEPFGPHLRVGDENLGEYLTALMNLDGTNEPDETKLTNASLVNGCDRVERQLNQCRPKVIVALTESAFAVFRSHLGDRYMPSKLDGFEEPRRGNTGGTFQLTNAVHRTWLIRAPQHPSHPPLERCWLAYQAKIAHILRDCGLS